MTDESDVPDTTHESDESDGTAVPDPAPRTRPGARAPGHPAGADRPRGGETLPAMAFGVAILGALGFATAYAFGANTQLLGIALFFMMGGVGVGLVVWAQRFMTPPHPDVEPRGRIESTEEEIEEFKADFNVGEHELERRSLLTKLFVGAVGAAGLAAIVPLKSLGPTPRTVFPENETPWAKGDRLVDEQGNPIKAASVNTDGVITVFPSKKVGQEFAQTLLIGLQPGRLVPVAGRESWTPQNLAAFSKVCTHVGCPVGLYEAAQGHLLCPCHQSTFDVYQACEPIFGPAATPLPQLPLAIDTDGFVVADGPFSEPPGPGYWNQMKS